MLERIGLTSSPQLALLNDDMLRIAGHLVSSWHSQMNIRIVSPFFGSSILPIRRGLRPHLSQVGGCSSSFMVRKLMMASLRNVEVTGKRELARACVPVTVTFFNLGAHEIFSAIAAAEQVTIDNCPWPERVNQCRFLPTSCA
jgi:hypothetical protein